MENHNNCVCGIQPVNTETALKITMDDRQFANQVASHNAHGVKQKCW